MEGAAAEVWGARAFQSEVRLITGRTHQVRDESGATPNTMVLQSMNTQTYGEVAVACCVHGVGEVLTLLVPVRSHAMLNAKTAA